MNITSNNINGTHTEEYALRLRDEIKKLYSLLNDATTEILLFCHAKFLYAGQLEYKTEKFQSKLILVDRFFPSSQICSNCGNHRHKMPLKNRVYICPDCGYKADRDLNAARNIDRWFEDIFIPERLETVSSTEIACGTDKPLRSHSKTAMKQEVNTKTTTVQLSLVLGKFNRAECAKPIRKRILNC